MVILKMLDSCFFVLNVAPVAQSIQNFEIFDLKVFAKSEVPFLTLPLSLITVNVLSGLFTPDC